MKRVHNAVYCSHCGDEIPEDELQYSSGSMCALCAHMRLEARQVITERRTLLSQNEPLTSPQQIRANSR